MHVRHRAIEGQRLYRFDFPIAAPEDLEVWREVNGEVRCLVLGEHYAVRADRQPIREGTVELRQGLPANALVLLFDTRTPAEVLTAYGPPADMGQVLEMRQETPPAPEPAPEPEPAPPSADERVYAEAARRVSSLTGCETWREVQTLRITNAAMLAALVAKRQEGAALSPTEEVSLAELPQIEEQVRAVIAAAELLLPDPPEDYTDDRYWPVLFG